MNHILNHPNLKVNQSAEIRKYVRALIERDTATAVIQQEVKTYFNVEMSAETIRTARKRMNAKKSEVVQPVKKIGSNGSSKNEPSVQIIETGSNEVLPGSKLDARFKIPVHIIALEAGYYVTVATACYGFSISMPGVIGYSFAVVYGLLSFAALQMVKDSTIPKTAEYGRNLVYVLEVIACVFAHYYTINRALWANLKALPFEVAYLPKGGIWEVDYAGNRTNGYWQNGEVVFNLACILAVILAGLAVAAISLRLELTKETNKK